MASQEAATAAGEKETQVPEWEHTATAQAADGGIAPKPSRSLMATMSTRFDSVMPPNKKYLGLRRSIFLTVLLAIILALVGLIVGLAVGLTSKSSSGGKDLPLPSNSQTFTGDLTYYQPGLGACGVESTSQDHIVSLSHILFDAAGSSSSDGGNSNNNPLCNKMLRASRYDEQYGMQRSVDLRVVDRCTGCQVDDLDTSLDAFTRLAAEADGRVDVTWAWLQPVATGK